MYFLSFGIAFILGATLLEIIYRFKKKGFSTLAQDIIQKAEKEANEIVKSGEISLKQKEFDLQKEISLAKEKNLKKIQEEEDRLKKREEKLDVRLTSIEKKASETEREKKLLERKSQELKEKEKHLESTQNKTLQELEKLSSLGQEEAKNLLFQKIEDEIQNDLAILNKRTIDNLGSGEKEAQKIIANAIDRLAVDCTSELTTSSIPIKNPEIKGRLIGREGRNIRYLEQKTGANFIIEDKSGSITISSFDPVRKHIAKIAVSELINDGRVHLTNIDEIVDKTKEKVKDEIKQAGKEAALQINASNIHPQIIKLLGKLKFRHSYGQNILSHSLEVAHIMGIMASELSLNVQLAKRIGLLHDIGKAASHDLEGSHATIGHNLAKKYGESPEVCNGIGCHHSEMAPNTIEASLCRAADSISASRPGARIESIEQYIRKLENLEKIASNFKGVENAYALQAGKEVLVIVSPNDLDDSGATNLARKIAQKVKKELTYPGQIKVTVLREKRVVEYAK